MPIERWSDRIVVVHLSDDPQFTDDLQSLEDMTKAQTPDVVLDFAATTFINSSNLAKLLKLRTRMIQGDANLVLCNVGTQVWSAFLVTSLEKVFHFSDNVPTSLATLQMTRGA